MFGLFKSSAPAIKVADKIWMSKAAKLVACREMISLNSETLLVAWFPETFLSIADSLNLASDQRNLLLAKDLPSHSTHGRMVVFAEHYPLPSTEQQLFKQMAFKDVPVLSSLDEPMFSYFGGEKLIEIMQKLGMRENEVISHSFVTKAIANAQRKIGQKVKIENHADSQQEWFTKNLGGRS
jgi:hypothetical protein